MHPVCHPTTLAIGYAVRLVADFLQALNPPRRLLMGSGPSNPEPRVLQAMAAAPPVPPDPAYRELLDDVTRLGRSVFQTSNAAALAVPGASRAGIEAVIASVVEPGSRVLVGVYGHFGELLCTLAMRHGAQVERVETEWGTAVDLESMRSAIRRFQPAVVAIVHADTSTGVRQPLDGLGAVCREVDALLVVDAVLSLGGCAVQTDDWQLDAVIGGMQKCLGGPPGLAPVTFGERVHARRAARCTPPRTVYLDLQRIEREWFERVTEPDGSLLDGGASTSTSMLLGAREALRLIVEEGLEERWARHARAAAALRAGLDAMGMRRFGRRVDAAPMISLIEVPDGVSEPDVRAQLLEEHGIEIMAAFGPLRGRVWRIGTMGTNASLPSVLAVLSGFEAVLASRSVRIPRGEGVSAAIAAWKHGQA